MKKAPGVYSSLRRKILPSLDSQEKETVFVLTGSGRNLYGAWGACL